MKSLWINKWVVMFLLSFLLVSCAGQEKMLEQAVTETQKPSQVAVEIFPSPSRVLPVFTETPQPTSTPEPSLTPTPEPSKFESGSDCFIRAFGQSLLDCDFDEYLMQSIAFPNAVWFVEAGDLENAAFQSEWDYANVKDLGFNTVRFALSYRMFENDENPGVWLEEGFAWLDQQIEFARQNEVYLVLDMHFVPGMDGDDSDSYFWIDEENQTRFLNLWKELAFRYKDEPVIAAYDLFNEPDNVSLETWNAFIRNLVQEVRNIDENHLFIVQAVAGLEDPYPNWEILEDDNILYDAHFYNPFEFTHQGLDYLGTTLKYSYPTDELKSINWNQMNYLTGAELYGGDTGGYWQEYYTPYLGFMDVEKNGLMIIGQVVPSCNNIQGESSFSSYSIYAVIADESDLESGFYLFEPAKIKIRQVDIFQEEKGEWYFWSSDGQGGLEIVPQEEEWMRGEYPGSDVIVLSGGSGQVNASNAEGLFFVYDGLQYLAEGYTMAEEVSPESKCGLTLDFFGYHGGNIYPGSIDSQLSKEYLASQISRWVRFREENDVPVGMTEFGVGSPSFDQGYGGINWVEDMLEILQDNYVHFSYWAYHNHYFGIYQDEDHLPQNNSRDDINYDLLNLFSEKLKE